MQVMWLLDKDGGFYAADMDQRICEYAYPTSVFARAAAVGSCDRAKIAELMVSSAWPHARDVATDETRCKLVYDTCDQRAREDAKARTPGMFAEYAE